MIYLFTNLFNQASDRDCAGYHYKDRDEEVYVIYIFVIRESS